MKHFIEALLLGVLVFAPALAHAEEEARHRFVYNSFTAVRHNPSGINEQLTLGYKRKIGQRPADDLLFGSSHIHTGTQFQANPLFQTGGVFFLIQPIAVLELRTSLTAIYSSNNGDPEFSYSNSSLNDATKAYSAYAQALITRGRRASHSAKFKYKQGMVVVVNTFTAHKFTLEQADGIDTDYFYDMTLDIVTPFNSWAVNNDADILAMPENKQWILGVRHTFTKPMSPIEGLSPESIQRIGPLFVWKFKQQKERPMFTDHALVLIGQWNLQHPFRTGSETTKIGFDPNTDPLTYQNSRLDPYAVLAYSFSGRKRL